MLIPRNGLAIAVMKVWRFLGRLVLLLRSKVQDMFDWLMNRFCTWLIRYYMGHGYQY